MIPKIEILNDSDPEYHETNPIYVETSPDQNDKFQVTAEEQEVLTREGQSSPGGYSNRSRPRFLNNF